MNYVKGTWNILIVNVNLNTVSILYSKLLLPIYQKYLNTRPKTRQFIKIILKTE